VTETEPDRQTQVLEERLQAMVEDARPSKPGPPTRDPVNRPQIHHWCDAIGDCNPVYSDSHAAQASIHRGIVAPPTMLQAWSMHGLIGRGPALPPDRRAAERRESTQPDPISILNEAGYTSVVATDCEQDYGRYLRPGDILHSISLLESVSARKSTGLGVGYFVTQRTTYLDQNDQAVGEMRFRTLWFKPHQGGLP
jgi:hypothetical protein